MLKVMKWHHGLKFGWVGVVGYDCVIHFLIPKPCSFPYTAAACLNNIPRISLYKADDFLGALCKLSDVSLFKITFSQSERGDTWCAAVSDADLRKLLIPYQLKGCCSVAEPDSCGDQRRKKKNICLWKRATAVHQTLSIAFFIMLCFKVAAVWLVTSSFFLFLSIYLSLCLTFYHSPCLLYSTIMSNKAEMQ